MADFSFLDSFFEEQQTQQERARETREDTVFLWDVCREKQAGRRA